MRATLQNSLIVSCTALLLPAIAAGHSPHDVITDIAGAPATGPSRGHLFIVVTDQVFRSEDSGARWKNLVKGLDNRFSFTSIAVSPDYASDDTVFAATAGDGVYRSRDGGNSWAGINSGLDRLDISGLSVSPRYREDGRILAASHSGGVWRRVAGAADWQMVLTETVIAVAFAERDRPGGQPWIYAGDGDGNVWRSVDNGRLWEITHTLLDGVSITSMHFSGGTLFLGTSGHGLFRSDDDAVSFQRVDGLRPERTRDCPDEELPEPVVDHHVTAITSSADDDELFVTSWYSGVFRSADGGKSWSSWNEGASCDPQADHMSVAHFTKVIESGGTAGQPVFWLAAFDGLFRRDGDGSDWEQAETLPVGLIKGMAVSDRRAAPVSIALATYGGGFYITDDAGSTWTIGNKGLITTRLTALSFSPDYPDDGVIYAGAIRRLLRSDDSGRSWQPIDLRFRSFGHRVVNKLERMGLPVDWLRSDTGVTLPVYPTVTAQPRGNGERVLFASRFHGVLQYRNDTTELSRLWSGTDEIINSFELSPDFPSDQTAFASVRGSGLIRSTDAGASWAPVNDGLDIVDLWNATPARGDFRRDMLIALSPAFDSDATVFSGSPAGTGLYQSSDAGDSWTRVAALDELVRAPVLAIALSPEFASDQRMIVSMQGHGLFMSQDAGRSFVPIARRLYDSNASVEWLEFSPDFARDRTVIAASDEQLFLSGDGGASWRRIARPVRYEDMREVVRYRGSRERLRGDDYSASTETRLSGTGSRARLDFVGTGVAWMGSKAPSFGRAEVFIDGETAGVVDCRSPTAMPLQELFVADGLEFGKHRIEVRPVDDGTGSTDPVAIDAFDVLPDTGQTDR